ncbi:hypothetical protein [Hymenobacter rubripertinctus]|uniref:Uncharacterized protein n=1 Tax=Hymenobacter rubripertinctus TaxID=2029981 RepID=A0A418QP64_9BACT|nr:hypothetical protein [Hymenobacter rubripertinctus]RIY06901.1 hypothetical protein D0T11_17900 [Hymenobacter rubripertinctus]
MLTTALHHYNDTPQPDFCGLSPAQMHQLLYQPLEPSCVVRLRTNVPNDVLDQVPFLRLTEAFLRLLQRETPLRLTPLGALPRKYLRELYAHGFILEEGLETGLFTLSREIDSLAITTLHQTTRLAGLARLVRGQLLLTKKGGQLLDPAQRPALWALVLDTFTNRFLWASNDGYLSSMVGQTGWAYSVYLLARFGQQIHPVSFYAAHYQRAFPFVLAEFTDPAYRTPLEQLSHCYGVRTFERGLNWFGLVRHEPQPAALHQPDQLTSAFTLLLQLFEVQQMPV